MKTKKFDLGSVKITMETNGFPKGLILKRDLTTRECRYIMDNLLGIDIYGRDEFYTNEEYLDYKKELVETVNKWLKGKADDESIIKYAYDCQTDQLGLMNMIPILYYLKRKNIID